MTNGTPLEGKNLLWRIKRSADTDYMLVACQVDLTFPLSRDVTTEKTKCGVSKSFSELDGKATINGVAMFDIAEADDAVSYNELRALIVAGDSFSSKFSDEDNNIYAVGDTKLQQLELSADSDTNAKFTANIEFTDPSDIEFEQTT